MKFSGFQNPESLTWGDKISSSYNDTSFYILRSHTRKIWLFYLPCFPLHLLSEFDFSVLARKFLSIRVKIIDSWFLVYRILITALELNYNKNQCKCVVTEERLRSITFVSNGTRVICTRWQNVSVTCHLLFITKEVSFQVHPHELFLTCSFNQSPHFLIWKNYELDVCCSSSSSSSSSSSPSSSFISLCVRTNFKVYSKLLDEETSRNHQAYRRGT